MSNNKLLTIIDRLLGSIFTFGNKFYVKYPDGKEPIGLSLLIAIDNSINN